MDLPRFTLEELKQFPRGCWSEEKVLEVLGEPRPYYTAVDIAQLWKSWIPADFASGWICRMLSVEAAQQICGILGIGLVHWTGEEVWEAVGMDDVKFIQAVATM